MIKQSGIYKITNLVNSKIYIGSAVNLVVRKNCHFRELRNYIHPNKRLQNAFNKHGEHNFKFEVLELVEDKTQLIIREQHYIGTLLFASEKSNKFDKRGYNVQRIADSSLGIKRSKIEKRRKRLTSTNRSTIQFTKNNKRVKTYFSVSEASRQTKIHKNSISAVCMKQLRTAGDYRWQYKEEYDKGVRLDKLKSNGNLGKEKKHLQKPVVQLDLQFNFIKEFSSLGVAAKSVLLRRADICIVCAKRNNRVTAGGFRWMYKSDFDKHFEMININLKAA